MTDNKRSTPDELRNTQDATFTTGEGKAPELGVKNASTEGSTYRPDWVPEEAKKDDTYACHVMKGVKEMHDGLLSLIMYAVSSRGTALYFHGLSH